MAVLAGIPPSHLRGRPDLEDRWQAEWETAANAGWTRRLLPRIEGWRRRGHGELSYYTTQLLSGHGAFGAYLHRFGITSTPECHSCGEEFAVDMVEHSFFEWGAFERYRREAEKTLGPIGVDNLVERMLTSKANWDAVAIWAATVLKAKA